MGSSIRQNRPNSPSQPTTTLLWHCHFRAAEKRRILVNDESRRFDVPPQGTARREFATFAGENVTLDVPSYFYRFGSDLALNVRVFSNEELARRIDCAVHLAID